MNWKIANEAEAAMPMGATMRANNVHSPAPSTRPASIRSFGIPRKKLRIKKMPKGRPKATWKMTTPGIVP